MSDLLIVNVAMTGCVAQKADNPALPLHPQEVADDARRCADEGATVFHLHARDARGNPLYGKAAYSWYVGAVREAVPGAVVCCSTSGRHFRDFEKRASGVLAGPDMASLSLGSVDFPNGDVSENGMRTVRGLLRLMKKAKVKPEFEAFDLAHALRLVDLEAAVDGKAPPWVNVILGIHLPAVPLMARLLVRELEGWTLWAVAGIGPEARAMTRSSLEPGGHVRVGLEDSLWMGKDDPATNPRLVARAVTMARALGREPATFAQAREALGL